MSIDTSSTQKVTSKYFSNKSGMDESLSDFQEKKRFVAPNSKQGKTKNKANPNSKKTLKKPRGQKDIRTVLKSKASDLVAYSKDFGNVCKQTGIDVDPEQLQLAIALSKSIQPSTSETQTTEPSSRERTARIRSTLQEYGFTVPEIKISNNNRRIKNRKKNYKLLLLTDSEKQRNIADKYSQVLLQNICEPRSPIKKVNNSCNDSKLFYLTTNVFYESIKDNDLYYLKNLPLEKSTHKGNLLRDWSEIPGRPVSPKVREDLTMDVSEILCSQEELNVILSGALKNAKNVINKLRVFKKSKDIDVEIIDMNIKCNYNNPDEINNKSLSAELASGTTRSISPDIFDDEYSGILDIDAGTTNHDLTENISLSNKSVKLPSSLKTVHPIVSNQSHLSQRLNTTKRKSNDVMELTECVGMTLNPSCSYTVRTHTTKRKSNDFMELTECVIQQKCDIKDSIDLTKKNYEKRTEEKQIEEIESINLTQSSNSSDALPIVQVSGNNDDSLNNTVILNDSELNNVNRSTGREDGSIETTPVVDSDQSMKSSHDLTLVTKKCVSVEDSSNESFFEDFLYNHSNSPEQKVTTSEKSEPYCDVNDETEIDLTQSPEYNNDTLEKPAFELENENKSQSTQNSSVSEKGSCNNELCDLHINNSTEIDLTQSPEYNNDTLENSVFQRENKDNTDLTQSSSTSDKVVSNNILADKVENVKSSLGKINNVSIDYDELSTSHAVSSINKTNVYDLSDVIDTNETESNSHSIIKSNTNSTNEHSENLDTSQKSQDSEVFEISDKELDYSMHKSRLDDCFEVNFGGISVIDSDLNKNNEASCHNKSTSDSFLPEVNIKRHELPNKPSNSRISDSRYDLDNIVNMPNSKDANKNHERPIESKGISPIKKYDIVKTPSNNEYIIKTDQVTPMGDYDAMSTPDRNKELDKYGLKPLKRKRAVQLLTYIYNQTHPIVQPCTSEIIQSPTKKRKTESSKATSPTKSPRKNLDTKTDNTAMNKDHTSLNKIKHATSSIKRLDINCEMKDNIYEVTNEKVPVKNIESADDEWVFQKREKPKLHSCRVPLHIAFHNYVSCRRGLQEAILRYEPVEIDLIHKGLAPSGYRYDPKDLLKFLDKKCITVKTADNNVKNNRK